ncbi:MAG TPA: SH3 domain-containing protein [Spirochaetota bacterium]|nr:SH3 domain-containing protein [Spirochaetota bacterium]HOR45116.1 SH3 domain-containing protein [Spirochaetota bacterium]HPK56564.1 SH3 domain-containing protein [Spirochaetota bacterium]
MSKRRIIFIFSAILITSFNLPASDYKIVGAFSGLTLRESPGLSAKAITTIPYSEKVNIIKVSDNKAAVDSMEDVWYKVKWRKYEGWVFGGYLLPLDQAENLKFKKIKWIKKIKTPYV